MNQRKIAHSGNEFRKREFFHVISKTTKQDKNLGFKRIDSNSLSTLQHDAKNNVNNNSSVVNQRFSEKSEENQSIYGNK